MDPTAREKWHPSVLSLVYSLRFLLQNFLHFFSASSTLKNGFEDFQASPEFSPSSPLSEDDVLVGDEGFHHQSLVPDVVERRHGVQAGGPHQRGAEDDPQVLAGHQVLLLVLGDSG